MAGVTVPVGSLRDRSTYARGPADITTVRIPVDWTEGDVAEEAAAIWEEGHFLPCCCGGALLLVSVEGAAASLTTLYRDEGDPSWPLFAQAVWARLVDVCAAMLLGNRQRRRAARGRGWRG